MLHTPKVHTGPAPRRAPRGRFARLALTMSRGSWVVVTHAEAQALTRAVRRLGGQSTYYEINPAQSCVKVLEAPWTKGVTACSD